jgi:RNA polymerase sigma-70 factor (ECF subfamily)
MVSSGRKDTGKERDAFGDPGFVARIRSRDEQALRAVVNAYLDQIFRAAQGAGLNSQQAEDVTQNTFVTFIETAHRFEGRSHVRTWIFGILYRKIAEERRQAQREGRTDDIFETMEQRFKTDGYWLHPPRKTNLDLEDAEIRQLIENCLQDTSPQQRLAFVMREVEGMESKEICNALDVSVTNLGVLLFRVRNRLRECLEKWGVKR